METRLASFKNWEPDWPKTKHLAYSGFQKDTESGAEDAVVCVFCTKCLEGWAYPELPHREHLEHAPRCILMNLASKSARQQTFEHGSHSFRPKVTHLLAGEGLFMYNIKEEQTTLICYACGFKCTVTSFPPQKSLRATITDLHAEFDPGCKKKREADGKEGQKESPAPIPYKILSCEVDLEAMPAYIIKRKGRIFSVTNPKISKSAEALAQALDTVQRENTPPSESQQVSPEEQQVEQKRIGAQSRARYAARSRRSSRKFMEAARESSSEAQQASAPQKAREEGKKETEKPLPELESIVKQLSLYISKQEKESLALRDALRVGLNRMIEVLGVTTYEEIEKLRQGLLASLADADA